jgi:ABC-type phosphate transport system substrate-binding protein
VVWAEASGAGRIDYLIANSAAVQAVGGALLTVLLGWLGTLFANRKRIAWRVYLDAPINLTPAKVKEMTTRLTFRVYVEQPGRGPEASTEVEVPWLAVLRVRNSGFVPIRGTDFNTPLTFAFPGREVRGAEVIEASGDSDARILPQHQPARIPDPARLREVQHGSLAERVRKLLPGPGPAVGTGPGNGHGPRRAPTSEVQVGREFLLNRRERFTLMIVLSGTPADLRRKVRQTGSLVGGRIIQESPRRGPSTRSLLFGGLIALPLAGLLAGLLVSLGPPGGSQCTSGSLNLVGSTAFAPAASSIARQYTSTCRGVRISASAAGSVGGLNDLVSTGGHHPQQAAAEIAMSDGPAPAGSAYRSLYGTPVGVIIFTVVVNRGTRVASLTTRQVQQIFAGRITNWKQVGGPDLPVRVVSRYPDSGTRRAFDRYVLGGATEPQPSSFDCTDKNEIPGAPVILCQEPSTQSLLQSVADVPGAIGFGESADVAGYSGRGVQPVELDGLQDTFGNIGTGTGRYPFWTVEYLYTYGAPAAGSLTQKFLSYMGSFAARDLVRQEGYTPCVDSTNNLMSTLCAPGAR